MKRAKRVCKETKSSGKNVFPEHIVWKEQFYRSLLQIIVSRDMSLSEAKATARRVFMVEAKPLKEVIALSKEVMREKCEVLANLVKKKEQGKREKQEGCDALAITLATKLGIKSRSFRFWREPETFRILLIMSKKDIEQIPKLQNLNCTHWIRGGDAR